MKTPSAVCCGILLAGLITGCGPKADLEKVVVSGTVTKGGQPLGKGHIALFPVGNTKGPVSGAEILNGKYSIDSKGGVPVGTHRVEFHEFEVDPKRDPTRPPPMVENNILPRRFNELSKLEFTAKSGGPMTKDFDLDAEFPADK